MNPTRALLAFVLLLPALARAADLTLPQDTLRDKVRGGLLGQMLGNLNGLPHEFKYNDEPGNVEKYVPSLPQGAQTDDDTDFEWVYVVAMQRENTLLLPPEQITALWKRRINRGIWCANHYARHLMDLGLAPPETGAVALNPWAEFNISGQFLCETYGLMAPAMPQTASRIGLNYTRVAIDAEPAQTTQLFCTMIATAFTTDDMEAILDAGVAALDGHSRCRQIVADVRAWHRANPADWRATRRLLKETYTQANGSMRDRNGYELMTGCTIAALLYGRNDLPETLRTAFNFGWDCDNSAATAGTIVGVIRGHKALMANGWQVVDRYRNTTRDGMPADETISSFADRVIDLAEQVILKNGGERMIADGRIVYRIAPEPPANVEPLPDLEGQRAALHAKYKDQLEPMLLKAESAATAAYLAVCLDVATDLRQRHPQAWSAALETLRTKHPTVVNNIFDAPDTPVSKPLKERAKAAGLSKIPPKK